MNITLHQLEVFKKVAELNSVTNAAKALHMTQPAVSNVLRLLNETLNNPVIEVINKRIFLTNTGAILLEASHKIKQTLDDALTQLSLEKGILKGTLKIATVSTAKYFILKMLGAFKKDNPAVTIQLTVKNRDDVLERLRHNQDDFVIMSQLPDNVKVDHYPFYEDELVVASANAYPMNHCKISSLHDLKQERWLIRETGSGTRMAMLNLFKKNRFVPQIEMEIDNNECIKQALMSNMGLSILSKQSIELEQKVGLIKIIALKGFPVAHEWYLVKCLGKTLSPIAQQFYDFVRSHPEVAHYNLKKLKNM